jgi:hypothetical protein
VVDVRGLALGLDGLGGAVQEADRGIAPRHHELMMLTGENGIGTEGLGQGAGCYTFCDTTARLWQRFWRVAPNMLDAARSDK